MSPVTALIEREELQQIKRGQELLTTCIRPIWDEIQALFVVAVRVITPSMLKIISVLIEYKGVVAEWKYIQNVQYYRHSRLPEAAPR